LLSLHHFLPGIQDHESNGNDTFGHCEYFNSRPTIPLDVHFAPYHALAININGTTTTRTLISTFSTLIYARDTFSTSKSSRENRGERLYAFTPFARETETQLWRKRRPSLTWRERRNATFRVLRLKMWVEKGPLFHKMGFYEETNLVFFQVFDSFIFLSLQVDFLFF